MVAIRPLLTLATLTVLLAGLAPPAAAQRARGSTRTSVSGSQSAQVNRSGSAQVNRSGSVNRNTNVNVNQNVNVHRDINVDVDDDWHDHDDWDDHPVARGVAIGTAAAVTAAAIGSIVYSVPPSCATVVVNGLAYQQCGSTWYQPQYAGSQVSYVVVNPPH